MILGLVESYGAMLFNSYIGQMLCFAVFLAVLFLKPSGLFGKKVR